MDWLKKQENHLGYK